MTKPIAEQISQLITDAYYQAHTLSQLDALIDAADKLLEQPENKQPLFTLEEVEQIAREAVAKCYVVSEVDPNCELHCNSEFPIEWWAKKKQLLEKQGK